MVAFDRIPLLGCRVRDLTFIILSYIVSANLENNPQRGPEPMAQCRAKTTNRFLRTEGPTTSCPRCRSCLQVLQSLEATYQSYARGYNSGGVSATKSICE